VATIVFVHAHPDDEASQTSGSMARAADEGHRVVVVYATNGDHGESATDLAAGETVADRRRSEALASAAVLGVARVEWLGYADSGMNGCEQNHHPAAFLQADLDEAASRLAEVLAEEEADVVVGYDWHGGYGHPDHVRVHHLVHRAAGRVGHPLRVLESTFNRDVMRRLYEGALAAGEDARDWNPDAPMDDGNPLGTPEEEIHLQVDVSPWLERRRASMEAHRSQATDIEAFLGMPEEVFATLFGTEHYLEPARPTRLRRGWILDA
jgi:LmbE family N-acetylglucosaminyl deacetylase